MKIYTFLSEAQREMYENYFLPSLPSEFEVCTTFHNDPYVEPTGDYYSLGLPCPEFTERMKTKALFMKKVCKENLGNTIVFADAGDRAQLYYVDDTIGWIILGLSGVAGPPVTTV